MKRAIVLMGLLVVFGAAAAANQHGSLAVTPDHPLYDTKLAAESGVENMAPNETERVKEKLDQADKRANESREMAEENETEHANETANAYAEEMREVNDLGKNISDLAQQQKIDELVARATQHHAEVLSQVYERVPGQAKSAIGRALNASAGAHNRAVQAMERRGQDTSGMNITDRIPSDVRDRTGIAPGRPSDTGPAGDDMENGGAPDNTSGSGAP